jgi:hypothetical protein
MGSKRMFLIGVVAAFLVNGCANLPYRYGQKEDYINIMPLRTNEVQVVEGNPNKFLDASDWIWPGSLIGKLILWNSKIDSHQFTDETRTALADYLKANDLTEVKVRINLYDAGSELQRTLDNRSVGAGWRYTIGILAWLQYTILPGRFFGGDHYNPYSDSINLYSDVPAVALHEAAHAKDFGRRKKKGTYAFAYMLPFFNLYPEAIATRDALGYLRTEESLQEQKEGYNTLYPAYGTYVGSNVGQWLAFPWGYVAMAAGVIPGHIAGRTRSATLPEPKEPGPAATCCVEDCGITGAQEELPKPELNQSDGPEPVIPDEINCP